MSRSKSASSKLKWDTDMASKKDFEKKAQEYLKKNGGKLDAKSAEDFFIKEFPQYTKSQKYLLDKISEAETNLKNAGKEIQHFEDRVKEKVKQIAASSEYKQLKKDGELNSSDLKFLEHGQYLRQIADRFFSEENREAMSDLRGVHEDRRSSVEEINSYDKEGEHYKKILSVFEKKLQEDVDKFQSTLIEEKKKMPESKMRGGLPKDFWKQKVRNPDTGNEVMLSSLDSKNKRHRQIIKDAIKKWKQ